MKDVQYPNRLGGLIEFAEEDGHEEKETDGSAFDQSTTTLPSKGRCMKHILQMIKETIMKTAFS